MRAWLQEVWYGGRPPPLWLRALAGLHALLLGLRGRALARGWLRRRPLATPVVVVGNLSVGGTGKTPLTIWLAERLRRSGLRVGVVLRGYGGRVRGAHLLADGDDAALVGDEACLIHARTGCPVAVGAERVAAARLLEGQGVQVIISDDGLQHWRLPRTAELVVVDGQRLFGNGRLLPAGPLREPVQRLCAVTAVIVNGAPVRQADGLPPHALPMSLSPQALQPVGAQRSAVQVAPGLVAGSSVHAVAGIGNPVRFFSALRHAGFSVIEHAFPDHHRYSEAELQFGDTLPVLMTEKDAVKCRHLVLPRHWYVPVEAQFAPADARRLLEKIFMDSRLLDLLVCPLCRGPLQYHKEQAVLVCRADRLAYPIRDGVPVMLEDEARALGSDDPLLAR